MGRWKKRRAYLSGVDPLQIFFLATVTNHVSKRKSLFCIICKKKYIYISVSDFIYGFEEVNQDSVYWYYLAICCHVSAVF